MKLHNIASQSLFLLAGITFFTACDNENDFADPNNRDGKPLRIETSIAETRAVVTGTSFSEGDQIGLFVLDDGGQYYADNAMNQQATYNGSGWDMQSEIVLSDEKTPYVFAVYPYYGAADYMPVDIDTRMRINIAPNQYEDIEGQADWMYANALPMEGNTAKLTFRHALARVTLQLKRGADEVGDGLLTNVRMQNATKYNASTNEEMGKGTKLQTGGIMSLSDGTIETDGEENANIELNTELVLSNDAQSIDILVIPTAPNGQLCTPEEGTTGGGIEIILTIDGKQYRIDLGVPTWHAGQQYVYPITISREAPVAEAVDLGLSVMWASWNVGATAPEEYGGYYAWGEIREKDEYSKKSCFTYGRSTSQLKTSSIIGSDGNLTSSHDVAATEWGGNWRIPTEAEIEELCKKCTWEWTTYNGVNGYFVIASNGNSIFLPVAGFYDGSSLLHAGYNGSYACATVDSDGYNAYSLYLNPSYYLWGSYNRFWGLTVRPVLE